MFRDLGRVHIVSFAVGIVGLIIGIVGIVLAIVFGTAQSTCPTPVTPTCPAQITSECNTNLFSINTAVKSVKWNDKFNNKTSDEYKEAVESIRNTLTQTLKTGLNNGTSSSSFLRIFAATGPTSNNVEIQISELKKGDNDDTIAYGNGAISAAAALKSMPNSTSVQNVINSDNTTYSNATTAPEVCNSIVVPPDCPVCSTPAPIECSTLPVQTTNTPVVTNPPSSSAVPVTSTVPIVSSSIPVVTSTVSSTVPVVNSTLTVPVVTSTAPKATSTLSSSSEVTIPTTTQTIASNSTTSLQTSPTQAISSTVTTQGAQNTSTVTTPAQGVPSSATKEISSTTASVASSSSVKPSTSPTTQGTPSTVATIGPGQCYYQSNIAVAVELTDPTSTIDNKMQNFITNNLLFYPGNPYQLGDAESLMTKLAIVPYPVFESAKDLMVYGEATSQTRIAGLFLSLGIFARPDAEINQSLDFIATLTYTGSRGFVIIVGNNGTSITNSKSSSQKLQQLGFTVITIGYNSTYDFSPLASSSDLSFKINQDSDELKVAKQIGLILNNTYCSVSSSVSPIITSTAAVITTSTIVVQSSSSKNPVTPTIAIGSSSTPIPIKSSSAPATSSSIASSSSVPVISSTAPIQSTSTVQVTSSVAPGTSTLPSTISPWQCYYQSNVAVAFELTNATSDIDLQIRNFITNDLFFYGGAPYELGHEYDGKTRLSLVPYPTQTELRGLMTYGEASDSSTINFLMDTYFNFANEPANISDAFNTIPKNTRTGEPGFVILVANSAEFVQAAVDSASNLKALGFNIITVAFKSTGSFDVLSSQPTYNFKIHQDGDQNSVAQQIGTILNTTYCSKPISTSSTTGSTVTYRSSSSTATPGSQTSTVTVPTTAPSTISTPTLGSSTSMFRSSSTVSYTTTSGPNPTTCVCTTTEPGSTSPGFSTSTYATSIGSSSYSTSTTLGSTSGPSQQSTTVGSSSSSSPQSTSSPSQQSTTIGGSSPTSQQSTTLGGSSSPSQQSSTLGGSSSSSPQSSTVGSSPSPSQQSTTQSYSTSTLVTSTGSSSYSTVTTPGGSSSPVQQSTTQSTVTMPSIVPLSSTTPGSTTSEICPNQQTVFKGQLGIIYEMLPNSNQQNTINAFVENVLLNSNFYGLALDNLTHENRTLVTAIPYPSTPNYNVQGYGSARSIDEFRNEIIAFNGVIKPLTPTSDISDALLYVTSYLPAGDVKSALIIVANSAAMIDAAASSIADDLKTKFDIYTVSVGDNPVTDKLSSLSSGDGFSFTGNTQQNSDAIGKKLAQSNPAVYCPPPAPSTSAPSTSTVVISSTVPLSTSVTSTTHLTTARPTLGPCECSGRFVYNGDLAIAFEYVKDSAGSQSVINFVNNTLLMNSDSYDLSSANQYSKLTIVPYPDSSNYPVSFPYGSVKKSDSISTLLDVESNFQTDNTDPSISDALTYINTDLKTDSNTKVVLLVGSNGIDVNAAIASANALKDKGYTVITVAQTVSADVFAPLASGNQYALHIGDGKDNDVAAQIANLLLDIRFVCLDDGSNTPSPITRCPGTQGTTQPGTTGTTVTQGARTSSTVTAVGSTSTQGSSTPAPGSSSTIGSTVTQVPGSSSTVASSSSVSAGSTTVGSTVTVPQGSSTTQTPGSSSSIGSSTAVNTESTTVGSTITNTGSSTTQGSSTAANTGSTVTGSGTSTTQPAVSSSTVSSGSTTVGTTVTVPQGSSSTQASTIANTGSTTLGSTVTQGSSTAVNTGSTTVPIQSSTSPSESTTPVPTCASPYKGKIATVFELNSAQLEIKNVVNFVRTNLYNSVNYDFTSITEAINVPYANTDNYDAAFLLQYNGVKSLSGLQSNIDNLDNQAVLTTNPTISDGLLWLYDNRDPAETKAVIIVVGNHDDDNKGLTTAYLANLRDQGYKVISVSVGATHGDFSSIADKPEWYFQVGDSNGQQVADQISYIICNL